MRIMEAVSTTGSRGQEGNWIARDKRLYLRFTGKVGSSLYRSIGEAVCTLKHPIRGNKYESVHQMDTYYISDGEE
jgi:hypothetical protein